MEIYKKRISKKFSVRISATTHLKLFNFYSTSTRFVYGEIISEAILSMKNLERFKDLKPKTRGHTDRNPTKVICTTIDASVLNTATELARQHGVTRTQFIELAILDYLARKGFVDDETSINHPQLIGIKGWVNPYKKKVSAFSKPSEAEKTLIQARLHEVPKQRCLFVDATILFLGITHKGANPKKATSQQCADLIERVRNGDLRGFTSVFEIARLCEMLDRYAKEPVPPESITRLFRFITVIAVGMEDLILDSKIKMALSVRAASVAFVKYGCSPDVATISNDFEDLFLKMINFHTDVKKPLTLYKPTDV